MKFPLSAKVSLESMITSNVDAVKGEMFDANAENLMTTGNSNAPSTTAAAGDDERMTSSHVVMTSSPADDVINNTQPDVVVTQRKTRKKRRSSSGGGRGGEPDATGGVVTAEQEGMNSCFFLQNFIHIEMCHTLMRNMTKNATENTRLCINTAAMLSCCSVVD